jgi:hypothetical protein
MRIRREATLDPEIARELNALEAALHGETVEPELAELEALVHDVREQRPLPSDEFAERLDARVVESFAKSPPASRFSWLRPRVSRKMLLPLGAAGTLVLGVIIASSVLGGDHRSLSSESAHDLRGQAPKSTLQSGSLDTTSAPPGATAAEPTPRSAAQTARKVERRAQLTLVAAPDRIDDVSDDVVRVTDRFDGIVLSSSVSSGDRSEAGAEFRLRVPSARVQPALAALSKLAHVRSRTENADDVTDEFNSTKGRLDEALAERNSLLRRLAAASTANEAASIRARLRINGQQIAQARSALRSVRDRTSFSLVELTVAPGSQQGGGAWTPGDALDDAVGVLTVTLGVLVVALSVILPLAVLGAFGAIAARGARRRRRDQALASG